MSERTDKLRGLQDRALTLGRKMREHAASWFFALLFTIVCAARLWSCVGPASNRGSGLQITEPDRSDPKHKRIALALDRVWRASASSEGEMRLFIAHASDINAASFGGGRFLFWDGTADLQEDTLEAIAAHEVAHDLLRHSQKAGELKDLTDFFGEAVSLMTGSDDPTEQTLKRWFGNAVLPKYSRTQELEADAKAVEILKSLGKADPQRTMATCLEALLSKYGNTGGKFFDSHPSTQERIEKLKKPQ